MHFAHRWRGRPRRLLPWMNPSDIRFSSPSCFFMCPKKVNLFRLTALVSQSAGTPSLFEYSHSSSAGPMGHVRSLCSTYLRMHLFFWCLLSVVSMLHFRMWLQKRHMIARLWVLLSFLDLSSGSRRFSAWSPMAKRCRMSLLQSPSAVINAPR